MRQLERIIFFLLLTAIPIQLGKHFWPNFAYVQGIRVDYLSPTLYLSDIFLFLLLIISLKRLYKKLFQVLKKRITIILLLVSIVSAIQAMSPIAAFYGILTFLKIIYFAFYVAQNIKDDKYFLIVALTLGGICESVILLFQFLSQASLGGPFYYLGERTFSVSTPGIALFPFNETLLLRPYGTFPHPNVASFYLLFGFSVILFSLDFKKHYQLYFRFCILAILFLGVLITFSRVVSILLILTIFIWSNYVIKNFGLSMKRAFAWLIIIIVFIFFSLIRFGPGYVTDLLLRMDLIKISWEIFLINPIIGVGLNNFFYYEIEFQKNVSPTLLQPVHNIYLLVLVQLGIAGFIIALAFIKNIIVEVRHNLLLLVFFLSVFTVGVFDHYLLTLQQGQLLLGIVLGLCYSKIASFKA